MMKRVLTLIFLLLSPLVVFISCSDKNENQPKSPKYYLKEEYVNGSVASAYEYDLNKRTVLKEVRYNDSIIWEYPSNDKVISKRLDGEITSSTTYTLNDKKIAISSVEESAGKVNKVVKENKYTYNTEGFLTQTSTTVTSIWFSPYSESISYSEVRNKIENGNIVESKTIFNDTSVLTTSYAFSPNIASDYIHKDDIFGRRNTHQIASSTFSGFIPPLGKISAYNSYENYVVNKEGLVESYSISGTSKINGVPQPDFNSQYKFVYEKFK